MSSYSPQFYASLSVGAIESAREILPSVLKVVPARSIIDVGCGIGAWLSVACELGVEDLVGIDGGYVNKQMLMIPVDRFIAADLSEPLVVDRSFDLALCLEVAEHLSQSSASTLITSLAKLAPAVLFSAAVPFQGGTEHKNEQWPPYWEALFQEHGFRALDCIRPQVWSSPRVMYWYAQNTLLFVHNEMYSQCKGLVASTGTHTAALALVHPSLFVANAALVHDPKRLGLRALLRAIHGALRASVSRRLNR